MTNGDTVQHFEATAPRALRLLAALGDPSGRGDIIRHVWAFVPAGVDPLDVVWAYRGDRASASRVVRGMGSDTRVEFTAWLYHRLRFHRCHVPRSVLAETLRAMPETERQQLATRLGGADALADALALAGMGSKEGAA